MEIKYKLYPYPVLSPYTDDYKKGEFDADATLEKEGSDIRINFRAVLNCPGLTEYINMGQAETIYHLECSQTGYRTVVSAGDKTSFSWTVSAGDVCGRLQICPYIVAVRDIPDFNCQDFHEDYQGLSFNIEEGCILAAGRTITATIKKTNGDMADTPSIFSVILNADKGCRQMLVEMGQQKIYIKLPVKEYYSFKQLNKVPQARPLLNSITVMTALVYILEELKSMPAEERGAAYSDCMWYQTLSSVFKEQFNWDIGSENFSDKCSNPVETAQKLIGSPLPDAFRMLTGSFGNEGDEEG